MRRPWEVLKLERRRARYCNHNLTQLKRLDSSSTENYYELTSIRRRRRRISRRRKVDCGELLLINLDAPLQSASIHFVLGTDEVVGGG